ncbi:MAG: class I SAM-dependent methyltransferase [Planctomycetes bacterium]|nr:class I SAM-dependent methyltransferase [Planctomycetota bacterium]
MLDESFLAATAELYYPGMGTENVAPLLYSLVRMLKPRSCLEVGLGYTTPFLARALCDNDREGACDRALLAAETLTPAQRERVATLARGHFEGAAPRPTRLCTVDNFALGDFSDHQVLRVLTATGTAHKVELVRADFAAALEGIAGDWLPLDLVWFDCGGLPDAIRFLNACWPRVAQQHGTVLLHYTHFRYVHRAPGGERETMLIDPLVSELKKRQALPGARFEVMSLLEPNKVHQSSVTMLRKLPPASCARRAGLQDEARDLFGLEVPPLAPLAPFAPFA